jgi:hypothetical protein
VRSELDVQVLDQPPAAGTAAPALKRASELRIDFADRALMSGRRRRLNDDLAIDDLHALVAWMGEEVRVGSEAFRRCRHDPIVSRVPLWIDLDNGARHD